MQSISTMETSLLDLLEKEQYFASKINYISADADRISARIDFVKTLPDCQSKEADIHIFTDMVSDSNKDISNHRSELSEVRRKIASHIKLITEV